MSETKWTSGEWTAHVNDWGVMHGRTPYLVIEDGAKSIAAAMQVAKMSPEEAKANAHLIAAAPDLYAALISVLDDLGAIGNPNDLYRYMAEEEADRVFAALAKARGEQ